MKNDKTLFKVAAILLLIVMIALVLVSSTYAKYTTTFSGSDTAVVAKWSVSAGNVTNANYELFDVSSIYDTNGTSNYTATGTDDEEVKNGATGEKGIIAPGTWGKFSYTLENDSDVTANYVVKYTVNEAGVPLEWSTNGTSWSDTLANPTANNIAVGGADVTETIYWRWAFEVEDTPTTTPPTYDDRDSSDTILGIAGTLATPSVSISVIFTQVD